MQDCQMIHLHIKKSCCQNIKVLILLKDVAQWASFELSPHFCVSVRLNRCLLGYLTRKPWLGKLRICSLIAGKKIPGHLRGGYVSKGTKLVRRVRLIAKSNHRMEWTTWIEGIREKRMVHLSKIPNATGWETIWNDAHNQETEKL